MYLMLARLKLKIKSFRLLPLYSTLAQSQSHSQIFTDYLVNDLGFSRSAALSASKKVCQSINTQNRPDSVVNFLQSLGLTKTQIKSIVSAHPSLLSYHVERTLQPKIQALEDIGFSGKFLSSFLSKDKSFLRRGLDKQIKPAIEYLRNVLGRDENLAQKKYHSFFQFFKPNAVPKKVEFFKKMGFPPEYVYKLLLTNPRCFSSSNEWLEKIFFEVEKNFGISPSSKMFYYAFLSAASLDNTMKAKCEIFRSFGCSDDTIFEMTKRSPNVLCISEGKLRKTWNFWVDELGYELDYMVKHPVVFSLSLDKRVKPRHEVLKILNEKKLNKRNTCLYTVLGYPESKFIEICLLPYKDVIPQVYSSYLEAVGFKERNIGKALV